MKYKLIFVVIIFTAFGCERRHVDLQENIEKQIDSASNHLLYFDSFRKIDGVEVQKETLRYEMTFKGFIGANRDVIWERGIYFDYTDHSILRLKQPLPSADSTATYFIKKDYGHEVDGRAVFEKRDSGWKLIAIYM